jgi:hypothetical protein
MKLLVIKQSPDDQQQQQHNVGTQITKHNQQDTNEANTNTINITELKQAIGTPHSNELIANIKSECGSLPFNTSQSAHVEFPQWRSFEGWTNVKQGEVSAFRVGTAGPKQSVADGPGLEPGRR